jgi:hypothetical protein
MVMLIVMVIVMVDGVKAFEKEVLLIGANYTKGKKRSD